MFNEVKEMLDATIYSNGNGEITAQNVNLAMHGIVDATEEKISELNESFAEVDTKIDEVYATIDEVKESGLGGITLKFPIVLMDLLYEDVDNLPPSFELTSDFVAIIGTEYPGLVEPLNQLIADNVAALEKIKATLDEGKEMPFVAIDVYVLYKELASILGSEDDAAIANLVTTQANINPAMIQYIDYSAIMPSYVGVMAGLSFDNTQVMFTFLATGDAGMENEFAETKFIVPAAGQTADNSANVLFFESGLSAETYASNRKHMFIYNNSEVLTPLSISGTSSYVYATFLIGRQFVKTTFNLTDGVTTSELLFEV